ncbi:MAG: AhpC/TSA family protein [Bacteroidales bacterium]|nr:AhpC/TSA family protein [Bacteroidales bacterium]
MKSLFVVLISFVSIAAFSQKVTVKGTLKNSSAGDTVFLTEFSTEGKPMYNAAVSSEGAFIIEFKPTETHYYRLGLTEKNYILLIITPGETIELTADATDLFLTFTQKGSKQSDLFYQANDQFMTFKNLRDSLNKNLAKEMELIDLKEQIYSRDFIYKNINSLACLMLIERLDKEAYASVYKSLDSALLKTYPTNKMVNDFHQSVVNMRKLTVGSEVEDIMLPNIAGTQVSLKSFRGKVVLIDFWATWCGPCKAEIPNLKRSYALFKDKGFEIFSVSLDRSREPWIAQADLFPWTSVYDAGGLVARDFDVQSIPHTILIDKNGKIVAKNLRGADLNLYLAELLGE